MKTNADVTLYNRVANSETYQFTQIVGVVWENRKASNVLASGGNIAADQASIYIPLARGANYLSPKEWQSRGSKMDRWTLQVGDYIVKGLVSDTIGTGFTISALKAKYDDVLVITSVDTMDSGSAIMRHWQLGAK